jgi:hypothetical protein
LLTILKVESTIEGSLDKEELTLVEEETGENTCTGITNGKSLDVEWYSPKGEVRSFA